MTKLIARIAVVGLAAAAANADVFMSFASDFNDQAWTWTGEYHAGHFALEDATPHTEPMTLLIDDGNGGLDPLSFTVDFNAHIDLEYISSTPIGGGKFIHSYHVEEGEAGWYTDLGPVVELVFEGAVMTIVGDEFGWDTAGSLFGSDAFADITYISAIDAPAYGLFAGESIGADDLAFTISVLNTSGSLPFDGSGLGATLDPDTMFPDSQIYAEGSYSGSANFVPTPGALALLGVAGLGAARRRR